MRPSPSIVRNSSGRILGSAFDKHRYNGPRVLRDEAVVLALKFAEDLELRTGNLRDVRHCRPIIYGRADDTFEGKWEIEVASREPPDPPGVVTCPSPDAPFIIEINDQTGEASLFMRI